MLTPLLDAFARTRFAGDVTARAPRPGETVRLGGLPGSSGPVFAAWYGQTHANQLVTIVAPTPAEAERWFADLGQLTDRPVGLYPQREALGEEEHHVEIAGERTETIQALLAGDLGYLVTTARASAERTAVPEALATMRLEIRRAEALDLRTVTAQLEAMGYERVPTVTEVAQFSVRGGIVDLYGFGMAAPTRCEWWGDVVESLRAFDLTTQRSGPELDAVTVLPVRTSYRAEAGGATVRRSLLELLPAGTVLVVESRSANFEEVDRAWREAAHHLDVARRLGEEVPRREDLFVEPPEWQRLEERFAHFSLGEEPVDLQAGFLPPEKIDRDIRRLRTLLDGNLPTLILCDNEGQLERLTELLEEGGRPSGATLAVGALDGGFVMPTLRVMTDHEVFRRARRLRRPRRYRQAAPTLAAGTLTNGDYVVHLDHGIGIYRGISSIEVEGGLIEVAVVEYQGGDRLHVPLYRLDQLERYRSAADDGDQPPPKIHKLGSSSWKKVREKTREAIQQMAAELLELYARRQVSAGFAFPPDTKWQRELESSFLYEDTPDQRRATDEVKRDLERPVPMDRLLVGDVGYGKTEIAVRAAFKAVQGGKQVAVLVPTTVLAEQHGRTFTERLADFPVRVEVLSRFRSGKELKAVLTEAAAGTIDIAIGTHRILSPDVSFKDLGLLVIDEEHRFGVKHKEQLKALKLAVDVLTLTATPIPRTLHMSLAGIRDLSLIETAPRDRSPILTFVEPWDDALLEEAFARELDRGGQVFVVHNRIDTIDTIAARVQALAPRARIGVGHGQMTADALEAVMRKFVSGEIDILVSTMIVESGIDVPNANTMVVHDAHRFGLAQLYRLRGRVEPEPPAGLLLPAHARSDRPRGRGPAEGARTPHRTRGRLPDRAQGPGDPGRKQPARERAVGACPRRRLRSLPAVARGDGQGAPERRRPGRGARSAGGRLRPAAQLPDEYVADDDTKLDVYRRLARAVDPGEIDELRQELRERFGPLPEPAEHLLDLTRLRVIGAGLGIQHILVRGEEARVSFRTGTTPRMAKLTAALDHVQLSADVRRTVPLSLRLVRLGGEGIIPALVRALRQVGASK
ncbi:MAG: CarD family transcriptional regulator [Gemmatimonadales bacterium]